MPIKPEEEKEEEEENLMAAAQAKATGKSDKTAAKPIHAAGSECEINPMRIAGPKINPLINLPSTKTPYYKP